MIKFILIFEEKSMKYLVLILSLNCIFLFNSQTTLDRSININGSMRYYRMYIPALYDGSSKVPLVFNFHGYTSNTIEQENYGDFRPIADTANFILVHPQGLDGGSGTFWNTFGTTSSTNFDYQFVAQLIDSLLIDYEIDDARIYSTGMSNGGFMSYDLACFMSNKFAAIASVTGSMISSHLNACNPGRRMPVMQIHGTNDQTVAYNGFSSAITSVPIDDLINFWIVNNNCNSNPTYTALPNINLNDNSTVEHFLYQGFNTSVELYKVINGGHTWPGTIFTAGGQVTNQDFSASKEIWRFFSQYNLNQETNFIDENLIKLYSIYPNPISNELNLKLNGNLNLEIKIFDVFGKLVYFNDSKFVNEIKINTESFISGIYFIQLGNQIEKIVVEK
jgi:polyhydroxybutyrate depolymerase